ncbi:MAG: D-alanyl-D-alanine carboxypeptidase/D-alanyl-D-alanine-endopeptidase [Gammaproteobacteria bacterium CG11_big_fil_rev_8_21_14_0_20_46_22]|nr:MAG: D-alanyl-D-alanine carboxypeptidase/D-alanyl-D-alanine-endopeptidase [Gammaproteobacteria bacterium CG12_big_fil_rev_8_21_14_0_65_46_12]PIR10743.1 MAG: D-alanyl-D-alanine carboxypeptidase/D-alanyl-D-alanine-endopeptidase [Gammaproteobacteria bacterium CG11_big_fil_rev_8_21_14_0_20_46_22]
MRLKRTVQRFIGLSLLGPIVASAAVFCANPSAQINTLIKHSLPEVHIGVAVMSADNGKIIYEHNAYQTFAPASNVKLLTAAAALYRLGPNYHYSTRLMLNKRHISGHTLNGDAYIIFSGDPTLTLEDVQHFIAELKRHNIDRIRGNIILDDSRFSRPDYAPGSSYEDHVWYYTAPISAILINQNALYFQIVPNKTLDKPAKVYTSPIGRAYTSQLPSHIKTVTFAQSMRYCSLVVNVSHDNTYQLTGCWPIDDKPKGLKLALRNPALFAERIIRKALVENHVQLTGSIKTGKAPKGLNVVSEKQSAKLKTLIITMMKDSNNIYAESLTKTLGAEEYGQGTFLLGTDEIENVLHDKTGINFQRASLRDGAGASRYDLLTPLQITRLLYVVNQDKALRKDFIESLPEAGTDGTLWRRMRSPDMKNSVEAKTGSMTGISTLSGYIKTINGQTLVFSIMVNGITGSVQAARDFQDELLSILRRD